MTDAPDPPADPVSRLIPAWAEGLPPPPRWRDSNATTAFANPWLRVTEHEAVAPSGTPARYGVARFQNLAAGILPIHADGTVTLVGQSRFPLMNYSWEMPEGGVPIGENPLAGARRELAEEAGLAAEHWMEVLRMELSNSVTDERAIAWLAWGLSAVPVDPDPTEVIAIVRVPFTALMHEIHRGSIRDAFTVATALRAYHMAREGLLPGWLAHAMLSRV